MLEGRSYFGLALTPDFRLFAIGGHGIQCNTSRTVEMLRFGGAPDYESAKNWFFVATLFDPRHDHNAAFFVDRIIVVGGAQSVESFHLPCRQLPLGQWTLIEPMDAPKPLFCLLPFGQCLIGIGRSTQNERHFIDFTLTQVIKAVSVRRAMACFSQGYNVCRS